MFKKIIILLVFFLFIASGTWAENIKNYSDCNVCPGTIHYPSDEARNIMGQESLDIIKNSNRSKSFGISIDLDGVLKPAIAIKDENGYELHMDVHENVIYIKSLLDASYIQIVADDFYAKKYSTLSGWRPEIYLQSSGADEIQLKDSVADAWKKMKTSHIYEWVYGDKGHEKRDQILGQKILSALKNLPR